MDYAVPVVSRLCGRVGGEWPSAEVRRLLAELDGAHRLHFPDDEGRDHQYEEADQEGAGVDEEEMPPFEFHHRFGNKVSVFGQGDEAVFILQPADQQAEYVTQQQAEQGDDPALVEEDAPDDRVAGTDGF